MSHMRIKKRPKRTRRSEGQCIADSLMSELVTMSTRRERVERLTMLEQREIRAVLDDDSAVCLLVVGCWGGKNGIKDDYARIGKMAGQLSSVLAAYELRKGGYIHWTGSDPMIDDRKTATTRFYLTEKSEHLTGKDLSVAAHKVFRTIGTGCALHRKVIIENKATEAYNLGILPMDKAVAREKLIAKMAADTGTSLDGARRGFEELEDKGIMGQNDDGSFWVKRGPEDDVPGLLIPDFYVSEPDFLN